MPNIEIIGFEKVANGFYPYEITKKIQELIRSKAIRVTVDGVITVHRSSFVEDFDGRSRPFVRVTSTNEEDVHVAKLINKELGLDVEWLHLDGFFEGKG